jgi:hypothetical protein
MEIKQSLVRTYGDIPWYVPFKAFLHLEFSDDDVCRCMIGGQLKSGDAFVMVRLRIINQAVQILDFLFVDLGLHDMDSQSGSLL